MTRALLPLLLLPAAFAQTGFDFRDNRDPHLACDSGRRCEMREQSTASTGELSLDGFHNGSITVRGWSGSEVRVRFRVQTDASSERAATDIFQKIRTRTDPGRIRVEGPPIEDSFFGWLRGQSWSVSAEVFVPYDTLLRAATHNGSMSVTDLQRRAELRTHNGSIRAERIGGDVRGTTHNGSLRISDIGGNVDVQTHNGTLLLTRIAGSARGSSHNGQINLEVAGAGALSRTLDFTSHNGSVMIAVPRSFSARVRMESHHGSLQSDFAAPPRRGDGDDRREFTIGTGEASIRVRTHNGSFRLRAL